MTTISVKPASHMWSGDAMTPKLVAIEGVTVLGDVATIWKVKEFLDEQPYSAFINDVPVASTTTVHDWDAESS